MESPSRRLGGTFLVSEIAVDANVAAATAREDATLLTRQLRSALGFVAQDGAGDDNFIVSARIVGYDETMTVAVDVFDRRNVRIARFDVSAAGSKRGWTEVARDTARDDLVRAVARYLQSNR